MVDLSQFDGIPMLSLDTRGLFKNEPPRRPVTFSGHFVPGETTLKIWDIICNEPKILSLCFGGSRLRFPLDRSISVDAGAKDLFQMRP